MALVRETETGALIRKIADKLKSMSEFKPPEWAKFVKTGRSRQRPPQDPDWWWIRAASILRKISLLSLSGSVGVSRLRKEYGGRKNRGHKPEHKFKASGSIIRKIIHQLESAGFAAKNKNKGRTITQKGIAFLKEVENELKVKSK